jgi:hypothetical protein
MADSDVARRLGDLPGDRRDPLRPTAIDEHIEARRKDKAFMDRLKKRHERERELFERLAK